MGNVLVLIWLFTKFGAISVAHCFLISIVEEERSVQAQESADQQWKQRRHREDINPTSGSSYENWISFKMSNVVLVFLVLLSCEELLNYVLQCR